MAAPKPMTAAELVLHPEYTHITWDLQPTKEGKAVVAIGRGGPINIAYEIHGHGNRHLVVRYVSFVLQNKGDKRAARLNTSSPVFSARQEFVIIGSLCAI